MSKSTFTKLISGLVAVVILVTSYAPTFANLIVANQEFSQDTCQHGHTDCVIVEIIECENSANGTCVHCNEAEDTQEYQNEGATENNIDPENADSDEETATEALVEETTEEVVTETDATETNNDDKKVIPEIDVEEIGEYIEIAPEAVVEAKPGVSIETTEPVMFSEQIENSAIMMSEGMPSAVSAQTDAETTPCPADGKCVTIIYSCGYEYRTECGNMPAEGELPCADACPQCAEERAFMSLESTGKYSLVLGKTYYFDISDTAVTTIENDKDLTYAPFIYMGTTESGDIFVSAEEMGKAQSWESLDQAGVIAESAINANYTIRAFDDYGQTTELTEVITKANALIKSGVNMGEDSEYAEELSANLTYLSTLNIATVATSVETEGTTVSIPVIEIDEYTPKNGINTMTLVTADGTEYTTLYIDGEYVTPELSTVPGVPSGYKSWNTAEDNSGIGYTANQIVDGEVTKLYASAVEVDTGVVEQINNADLVVGKTYYFDMSYLLSEAVLSGRKVSAQLPDESLVYTPFVYVGTVNSYNAKEQATDRTLFIADSAVIERVSYDTLNEQGYINGANFTSRGVQYTLRAPSASQNAKEISPSSDWATIYAKSKSLIKNWGTEVLGQDVSDNNVKVLTVGGENALQIGATISSATNTAYRPVLELENIAQEISSVKVSLNGGTLAKSATTNTVDILYNIGTLVAPTVEKDGESLIIHQAGFGFKEWNTKADGTGLSYNPGEIITEKTTELYAIWVNVGLVAVPQIAEIANATVAQGSTETVVSPEITNNYGFDMEYDYSWHKISADGQSNEIVWTEKDLTLVDADTLGTHHYFLVAKNGDLTATSNTFTITVEEVVKAYFTNNIDQNEGSLKTGTTNVYTTTYSQDETNVKELNVWAVAPASEIASEVEYAWYEASTQSDFNGKKIKGQNTNVYTPDTDLDGTYYYYATATVTTTDDLGNTVVDVVTSNMAEIVTTEPRITIPTFDLDIASRDNVDGADSISIFGISTYAATPTITEVYYNAYTAGTTVYNAYAKSISVEVSDDNNLMYVLSSMEVGEENKFVEIYRTSDSNELDDFSGVHADYGRYIFRIEIADKDSGEVYDETFIEVGKQGNYGGSLDVYFDRYDREYQIYTDVDKYMTLSMLNADGYDGSTDTYIWYNTKATRTGATNLGGITSLASAYDEAPEIPNNMYETYYVYVGDAYGYPRDIIRKITFTGETYNMLDETTNINSGFVGNADEFESSGAWVNVDAFIDGNYCSANDIDTDNLRVGFHFTGINEITNHYSMMDSNLEMEAEGDNFYLNKLHGVHSLVTGDYNGEYGLQIEIYDNITKRVYFRTTETFIYDIDPNVVSTEGNFKGNALFTDDLLVTAYGSTSNWQIATLLASDNVTASGEVNWYQSSEIGFKNADLVSNVVGTYYPYTWSNSTPGGMFFYAEKETADMQYISSARYVYFREYTYEKVTITPATITQISPLTAILPTRDNVNSANGLRNTMTMSDSSIMPMADTVEDQLDGATITGYQWYKATYSDLSDAVAIDGATSEEYTPTMLISEADNDVYKFLSDTSGYSTAAYYYCDITFTIASDDDDIIGEPIPVVYSTEPVGHSTPVSEDDWVASIETEYSVDHTLLVTDHKSYVDVTNGFQISYDDLSIKYPEVDAVSGAYEVETHEYSITNSYPLTIETKAYESLNTTTILWYTSADGVNWSTVSTQKAEIVGTEVNTLNYVESDINEIEDVVYYRYVVLYTDGTVTEARYSSILPVKYITYDELPDFTFGFQDSTLVDKYYWPDNEDSANYLPNDTKSIYKTDYLALVDTGAEIENPFNATLLLDSVAHEYSDATSAPKYQWYYTDSIPTVDGFDPETSGTKLIGQTDAEYAPLQSYSNNGYYYYCIVTTSNENYKETSKTIVSPYIQFTVDPPYGVEIPVITLQPVGAVYAVEDPITPLVVEVAPVDTDLYQSFTEKYTWYMYINGDDSKLTPVGDGKEFDFGAYIEDNDLTKITDGGVIFEYTFYCQITYIATLVTDSDTVSNIGIEQTDEVIITFKKPEELQAPIIYSDKAVDKEIYVSKTVESETIADMSLIINNPNAPIGEIKYQWYVATELDDDGNPVDGEAIVGENLSKLQDTDSIINSPIETYYYYCEVWVHDADGTYNDGVAEDSDSVFSRPVLIEVIQGEEADIPTPDVIFPTVTDDDDDSIADDLHIFEWQDKDDARLPYEFSTKNGADTATDDKAVISPDDDDYYNTVYRFYYATDLADIDTITDLIDAKGSYDLTSTIAGLELVDTQYVTDTTTVNMYPDLALPDDLLYDPDTGEVVLYYICIVINESVKYGPSTSSDAVYSIIQPVGLLEENKFVFDPDLDGIIHKLDKTEDYTDSKYDSFNTYEDFIGYDLLIAVDLPYDYSTNTAIINWYISTEPTTDPNYFYNPDKPAEPVNGSWIAGPEVGYVAGEDHSISLNILDYYDKDAEDETIYYIYAVAVQLDNNGGSALALSSFTAFTFTELEYLPPVIFNEDPDTFEIEDYVTNSGTSHSMSFEYDYPADGVVYTDAELVYTWYKTASLDDIPASGSGEAPIVIGQEKIVADSGSTTTGDSTSTTIEVTSKVEKYYYFAVVELKVDGTIVAYNTTEPWEINIEEGPMVVVADSGFEGVFDFAEEIELMLAFYTSKDGGTLDSSIEYTWYRSRTELEDTDDYINDGVLVRDALTFGEFGMFFIPSSNVDSLVDDDSDVGTWYYYCVATLGDEVLKSSNYEIKVNQPIYPDAIDFASDSDVDDTNDSTYMFGKDETYSTEDKTITVKVEETTTDVDTDELTYTWYEVVLNDDGTPTGERKEITAMNPATDTLSDTEPVTIVVDTTTEGTRAYVCVISNSNYDAYFSTLPDGYTIIDDLEPYTITTSIIYIEVSENQIPWKPVITIDPSVADQNATYTVFDGDIVGEVNAFEVTEVGPSDSDEGAEGEIIYQWVYFDETGAEHNYGSSTENFDDIKDSIYPDTTASFNSDGDRTDDLDVPRETTYKLKVTNTIEDNVAVGYSDAIIITVNPYTHAAEIKDATVDTTDKDTYQEGQAAETVTVEFKLNTDETADFQKYFEGVVSIEWFEGADDATTKAFQDSIPKEDSLSQELAGSTGQTGANFTPDIASLTTGVYYYYARIENYYASATDPDGDTEVYRVWITITIGEVENAEKPILNPDSSFTINSDLGELEQNVAKAALIIPDIIVDNDGAGKTSIIEWYLCKDGEVVNVGIDTPYSTSTSIFFFLSTVDLDLGEYELYVYAQNYDESITVGEKTAKALLGPWTFEVVAAQDTTMPNYDCPNQDEQYYVKENQKPIVDMYVDVDPLDDKDESKLYYAWYYYLDGDDTTKHWVTGAVGTTLTPSVENEGVYEYYLQITSKNQNVSGEPELVEDAGPITITVIPYTNAIAPELEDFNLSLQFYVDETTTIDGSNDNIIDASSIITNLADLSEPQYQWYEATTATNTGKAIDAPEGTSATFTVPTDSAKTTYYYCIIKNYDSSVDGLETSEGVRSDSVKVEVIEKDPEYADILAPSFSPTEYRYEQGTTTGVASLDATQQNPDVDYELTYIWYSMSDKDGSDLTIVQQGSNAVLTIPTEKVGELYYYCVIQPTDSGIPVSSQDTKFTLVFVEIWEAEDTTVPGIPDAEVELSGGTPGGTQDDLDNFFGGYWGFGAGWSLSSVSSINSMDVRENSAQTASTMSISMYNTSNQIAAFTSASTPSMIAGFVADLADPSQSLDITDHTGSTLTYKAWSWYNQGDDTSDEKLTAYIDTSDLDDSKHMVKVQWFALDYADVNYGLLNYDPEVSGHVFDVSDFSNAVPVSNTDYITGPFGTGSQVVDLTHTPSAADSGITYYFLVMTVFDYTNISLSGEYETNTTVSETYMIMVNPIRDAGEPLVKDGLDLADQDKVDTDAYAHNETSTDAFDESGFTSPEPDATYFDGTITVEWFVTQDPLDTKTTTPVAAAADGKTYPDTSTPGTYYYFARVTNTAAVNGIQTNVISYTDTFITIEILDALDGEDFTAVLFTDATYDEDDSTVPLYIEIEMEAGSDPDDFEFTYTWYRNTTGIVDPGAETPYIDESTTQTTLTPDISDSTDYYYYCVVSYVDTRATQNEKVSVITNSVLISIGFEVAEMPSYVWLDSNSYEQFASAVALDASGSTITKDHALTYTWYETNSATNDDYLNDTTNIKEITEATGATYTPKTDLLDPNPRYYFCVITNNDTSITNDLYNTAVRVTNIATITITDIEVAEMPSYVWLDSNTYDQFESAVALDASGSTITKDHALTYTWYESTTVDNFDYEFDTTNVKEITGATTAFYTPITNDLTPNPRYYFCVITNNDPDITNELLNTAVRITNMATITITFDLIEKDLDVPGPVWIDELQYDYFYTIDDPTDTVYIQLNVPEDAKVTVEWFRHDESQDSSEQGYSLGYGAEYEDDVEGTYPGLYAYDLTSTAADSNNNNGYYYIHAEITLTYIDEDGGEAVEKRSATVTVRVTPPEDPQVPYEDKTMAEEYTYVVNTTPTDIFDAKSTVTDGGTVTYQWYYTIKGDSTVYEYTTDSLMVPLTGEDQLAEEYRIYWCINTNTLDNGAQATWEVGRFKVNIIPEEDALPPIIEIELTDSQVVDINDPDGILEKLELTVSQDPATSVYAQMTVQWFVVTGDDSTVMVDGEEHADAKLVYTKSNAADGEHTYLPPVDVAGTYYYYCVITNYDTDVTGNPYAHVVSNYVTIEVVAPYEPEFEINELIPGYYVVDESAIALDARATHELKGDVTVTYDWYVNYTVQSVTGGELIDSLEHHNDGYYVPPTDHVSGYYYYCIVTVTETIGDETFTASKTTNVVIIDVTEEDSILKPVFGELIGTYEVYEQGQTDGVIDMHARTYLEQASGTDHLAGVMSWVWYEVELDAFGDPVLVDGNYVLTEVAADIDTDDDKLTPNTNRDVDLYAFVCIATNTVVDEFNGETRTRTRSTTSGLFYYEVIDPIDAETPIWNPDIIEIHQTYTQGERPDPIYVNAYSEDAGYVTLQWYQATEYNIYDTDGEIDYDKLTEVEGGNWFTSDTTQASGQDYYYVCIATNNNSQVLGSNTATAVSAILTLTIVDPVDAGLPIWDPDLIDYETQPAEDILVLEYNADIAEEEKLTAKAWSPEVADEGYISSIVWFYYMEGETEPRETGTTGYYQEPFTDVEGTYYYFAVAVNTYENATGIKEQQGASSVQKVIVNDPSNATAPIVTIDTTKFDYELNEADIENIVATATQPGDTNSTSYTYQWYRVTEDQVRDYDTFDPTTDLDLEEYESVPVGINSDEYTLLTNTTGIYYYYCVVTNYDENASGEPFASGQSNIIKIEVGNGRSIEQPEFKNMADDSVDGDLDDTVVINLIAGTPSTEIDQFEVEIKDLVYGNASYQWYRSTTNSYDGTAISFAYDTTYKPSADELGTYYYYCVVTNTDNFVDFGPTQAYAYSKIVQVNVTNIIDAATPTLSDLTSATYEYEDYTIKALVTKATFATGSTVGEVTYTWYSSPTTNQDDATEIKDWNQNYYVPDNTAIGDTYYWCIVTHTDTSIEAPGEQTITIPTNKAKITVKDPVDAQVPTIVITNPDSHVHQWTEGSAVEVITAEATVTDGGSVVIEWYKTKSNSNVIDRDLDESTGVFGENFYPTEATEEGQYYYYAVAVNTNYSVTGEPISTEAISKVVLVDVNPEGGADKPTFETNLSEIEVTYVVNASADTLNPTAVAPADCTLSFKWFMVVEGGDDVLVGTNAEFTPPTGYDYCDTTTEYYCIAYSTHNATGSVAWAKTNVAKITVIELPNVDAPEFQYNDLTEFLDDTFAVGTVLPLETAVDGKDGSYDATAFVNGSDMGVTYQWYTSATGTELNAKPISGATSAYFTPFTSEEYIGETYYFCKATYTDISIATGGTSANISDIFKITITERVDAGDAIYDALKDATYTLGQTEGIEALVLNAKSPEQAEGGLITEIEWYVIEPDGTERKLAQDGQDSIIPPTSTDGVYKYYAVIKNEYADATGSTYTYTTTNVATITVNNPTKADYPYLLNDLVSAIYVVDADNVVALDATAFVSSGTLSYQWYVIKTDADGAPLPAEKITDASTTSGLYTPPVTAEYLGNTRYYCVITNTDDGKISTTLTTNNATITVVETLDVEAPIITNRLEDAEYFQYEFAKDLDASATVLSTPQDITYKWFYLTQAELDAITGSMSTAEIADFFESPTGGKSIASETDATYKPSTNSIGVMYYYCVVTNENVDSVQEIKYASTTSNLATITVKETTDGDGPTVQITGGQEYYKNTGDVNPLVVTATREDGSSTEMTYVWYKAINGNETAGTIISGETTNEYYPPVDVRGEFYYFCIVTDTRNNASRTSDLEKVTVVSKDDAQIPLVKELKDAEYIVDTAYVEPLDATATLYDGTEVTDEQLYYQWYTSTSKDKLDGIPVDGTPILNATYATYTPPVDTVGEYFYYCEISYTDPTVEGNKNAYIYTNIAQISVIEEDDSSSIKFKLDTIDDQYYIFGEKAAADPVDGTAIHVEDGSSFGITYQWFEVIGGVATAIATEKSATFIPDISAVSDRVYLVEATYQDVTISSNEFTVYVVQGDDILNGDGKIFYEPLVGNSYKVNSDDVDALDATAWAYDADNVVAYATFEYQWFQSLVNDQNSATAVSPAQTDATFVPPVTETGTTYYFARITYYDIDGLVYSINTNTAAIIVYDGEVEKAELPIVPVLDDAEYMRWDYDKVVDLDATSYLDSDGSSDTLTYQWYDANTGLAIGGETSATYTPSVENIGDFYYYCVVTNTGGTDNTDDDVSIRTNTAYIRVNEGKYATIPNVKLDDATYKIDETSNALDATVDTSDANTVYGTLTYEWYVCDNLAGDGAVKVTDTTLYANGKVTIDGSYLYPYTGVEETYYYYCVIKNDVSDDDIAGENPVFGTTNTAQITVTNLPTPEVPSIGNIECEQGEVKFFDATTTVDGEGKLSYEWFEIIDGKYEYPETITDVANTTSATFYPNTTDAGDRQYVCVITYTEGTSTTTVTTRTDEGFVKVTEKEDDTPLPETPRIDSENGFEATKKVTYDKYEDEGNVALETTQAVVDDGGKITYKWSKTYYAGDVVTDSNYATGQSITPEIDVLGTYWYTCTAINTLNGVESEPATIFTLIVYVTANADNPDGTIKPFSTTEPMSIAATFISDDAAADTAFYPYEDEGQTSENTVYKSTTKYVDIETVLFKPTEDIGLEAEGFVEQEEGIISYQWFEFTGNSSMFDEDMFGMVANDKRIDSEETLDGKYKPTTTDDYFTFTDGEYEKETYYVVCEIKNTIMKYEEAEDETTQPEIYFEVASTFLLVAVKITDNIFDITLDLNGGNIDGETDDVILRFEDDITVGELPVPEKDGNTFEGWQDEDGNLLPNDTVLDSDSNLTATWKPTSTGGTSGGSSGGSSGSSSGNSSGGTTTSPTEDDSLFDDIDFHWAEDDINSVARRGFFDGIEYRIFAPEEDLTRGMIATIIGRIEGINFKNYSTPTFNDVNSKIYYAPYIDWAERTGVVQGYNDTEFRPDQAITREEMALILFNYFEYKGYDFPQVHSVVRFLDHDTISSWALNAVETLQMAGVIDGRTNYDFDPQTYILRSEAAAMTYDYLAILDVIRGE